MTVEEIFGKLRAHMLEGMMFHDQMANYYDFLNLRGYKRCHEYHYFEETISFRCLCRYFTNHYNMLVLEDKLDTSSIIPQNWWNYQRQEVDTGTKRSAVKTGIDAWVNWEKETKTLYQNIYKELTDIGEIAAAKKICELICDVDCELKYAEREQLDLESIGYDLVSIVLEQAEMHDCYKHKIENLCIEL